MSDDCRCAFFVHYVTIVAANISKLSLYLYVCVMMAIPLWHNGDKIQIIELNITL